MRVHLLAVLLVGSQACRGLAPPVRSPEPRPMNHRFLVQNYKALQGQEVVVAGYVSVYEEGVHMPLEVVDADGEPEWLHLDFRVGVLAEGPTEKRFLAITESDSGRVDATLQGIFRGAETSSFGHMGKYRFELSVTHVLAVEATSKPPWFVTSPGNPPGQRP